MTSSFFQLKKSSTLFTLLLASGLLFQKDAFAQFSGNFAPAKWTLSLRPVFGVGFIGTVYTSAAPNAITLFSGNDIDPHGGYDPSNTFYEVNVPVDGQISFNWNYFTQDGADLDYPMYSINGQLYNFLTFDKQAGAASQVGSITAVNVNKDDVFGLVMYSSDAAGGPGRIVVTDFSFVSNTPLPITLGSFSALAKPEGNLIQWETLKEDVGDYFEVERSINGVDFESIATFNAHVRPSAYHYLDPTLWNNSQQYYRLKMRSSNGQYKYSKVVVINRSTNSLSSQKLFITPNPSTDQFILNVDEASVGSLLSIFNALGAIQYSAKVNTVQDVIDVSGFPAGVYNIIVQDNTRKQFAKFVKK